jgi:hypothetical protein
VPSKRDAPVTKRTQRCTPPSPRCDIPVQGPPLRGTPVQGTDAGLFQVLCCFRLQQEAPMTWPTLLQVHSTPKTRLSRRQRIDRIVRRAVRRAVCECTDPRRAAAGCSSSPRSQCCF